MLGLAILRLLSLRYATKFVILLTQLEEEQNTRKSARLLPHSSSLYVLETFFLLNVPLLQWNLATKLLQEVPVVWSYLDAIHNAAKASVMDKNSSIIGKDIHRWWCELSMTRKCTTCTSMQTEPRSVHKVHVQVMSVGGVLKKDYGHLKTVLRDSAHLLLPNLLIICWDTKSKP